MNPTEQKNHKTALQTLEAGMLNFAEETVNRMDGLSTYIAHVEASFSARLGEERAARVEDRYLDQQFSHYTRDTLLAFMTRGFWSRLNWLIRGR